jgi:hypothetical protein
METLNQIGGNLNRGISVFYEIIYLCTYSLGYLPADKRLPPDDTDLVDELHEERRLGSLWIVQDALNIRDRLVPRLKKVCGEFEGAHRMVQDGGILTKENVIRYFANLSDVITSFSTQSQRLTSWTRQIELLHSKVQAKEKPSIPGQEGYYSYQDAADKLGRVLEEAGKLNVSWAGMEKLAEDTVKELERAQSNPNLIVKEMFLQAAAKQWEDIVTIAAGITDIMQNVIKK